MPPKLEKAEILGIATTSVPEDPSLPIYEYACVDCGRHIEVKQSFSDEPLKVCPHCRGKLRRVFHPVGVLFKGSGFYHTDSRNDQKASAQGKSKPEDKAKVSDGSERAGGAKGEGKAEGGSKEAAKPASKAEKTD